MEIQFIGAVLDVTGSMTLLENNNGKILIDCGLYQGTKEIEKRNSLPLPFNPKEIDAIVLTHAHLDHSGYIPKLVKLGFRGDVFCTPATAKLSQIIMEDSANLMEEQAKITGNPFYAAEDVIVAMSLFKTKKFNEKFEVNGMNISLIPAGHILGAASVLIEAEKRIVFSGDLGRRDDPLIAQPLPCPDADIIVIESTYGGRSRTGIIEEDLKNFLQKIKKESRVGIIASFAVARAQLLITLISEHFNKFPEDKIRFVIDGPMMIKANQVFNKYSNDTKQPLLLRNSLAEVETIEHIRQWNSLKKKEGPLLVVTSSGMITGGRIWRYLENWQNNLKASLFLPGFQGLGTAGRKLSEGERKIHDLTGKEIIWSGEVITSSAFSSHADQSELIEWLKNVNKAAEIYINHGEESSKISFKEKLLTLGYTNVNIANCK
jgi:metallo-beta-lactamase family protein